MKTAQQVVNEAMAVRPLTEVNERECVASLALALAPGSLIVEIGCLYGGMTAVLALAAPECKIVTIDDFSWHPADDVPTSEDLLYANMVKIGARNVSVMNGDSRVFGSDWTVPIDLCWIDGGHSYDYVFLDLMQFGARAKVIAVHDFDNPYWGSIRQAVEEFIRLKNGMFVLSEVVGTVAVLKRS